MSEQREEGQHIPAWTLGDRLQKARDAAGLTQDDIAIALTLKRSSVAQFEAGRRVPRLIYLQRWADTCHVPLEWLVGNTDAGADGPDPGNVSPITGTDNRRTDRRKRPVTGPYMPRLGRTGLKRLKAA